MIFDSHTHLDDNAYDTDRDDVISSLLQNGVGLVVNCGADMATSASSVALAAKYPHVYAAVGVHPHDSKDMVEEDIATLRKYYLGSNKVKAIGEIGLDYHYDNSPREIQRYWFEKQMELAYELSAPVVLHVREAFGDAMDIIRRYKGKIEKAVLHCCSASVEIACECVDYGYYMGIGGAVTFKSAAKVKEVVRAIPKERILLETDCPYMTPLPYSRRDRNEPKYSAYSARVIGEILGISGEEVESITYANACKFFNITDGL